MKIANKQRQITRIYGIPQWNGSRYELFIMAIDEYKEKCFRVTNKNFEPLSSLKVDDIF